MRSRLCVTVFGGVIAAALFAACAEGTDFDGDTADASPGGDRGNRDAEVASSSSSGGSSSSGQTSSSSSGASIEVDAAEADDAATDATADDASIPVDSDAAADAGGSSSSSSGVVPPAPANPILHSATANPTTIDAPQGSITFALNMSDVNGDYKHIEMVLIYPDNTRENKNPVVIPASYDGNPGPFTLNLPVNFQTEDTGNYKFAFRIVDDTNRKSAELRVDIRVR